MDGITLGQVREMAANYQACMEEVEQARMDTANMRWVIRELMAQGVDYQHLLENQWSLRQECERVNKQLEQRLSGPMFGVGMVLPPVLSFVAGIVIALAITR